MKTPDIIQAVQPVISAFDDLSIPYYIGGSIASSLYGIARTTMDVDIVADLKLDHVSALQHILKNEYYVNDDAVKEAIRRVSSFNLIHLKTIIKIDIFIHANQPYAEESLRRKKRDTFDDSEDASEYFFSSPEDVILNKLRWYEMGNRISERQWLDVLGVIKVQGNNLDNTYLRMWGESLSLLSLLEKAFLESEVDY